MLNLRNIKRLCQNRTIPGNMLNINILPIILLFIILLFSSCKKENPNVRYNDILVEGKNFIDNCFLSFNKQVNTVLTNQQYSLVSEYCKITLDSLSNKTVSIENVEYPVNANNFRDAFLLYSKSVQEVVKSYENYAVLSDENATIQQLDSVNSIIKKAELRVSNSLNNLLLRQMEFAAEKNLKLEYERE